MGYTALPPPLRRGRSRAGTMDDASGASRASGGSGQGSGDGAVGGGSGSGTGAGTGTGTADQTSSGNLRSIPDEQLFYRVPVGTASSKDTSSGGSSYRARAPGESSSTRDRERDAAGRSGWFSRFSYSGVAGLPPGAAAPFWMRTSGESERTCEGVAGGEGAGSERGHKPHDGCREGAEGDAMSIAVPDTPTVSGDGSLGGSLEFGRRTRWSDVDWLSFPVPPPSARVSPADSPRLGGFLIVDGVGNRDSVASRWVRVLVL